jgi:hypothetical protein
VWGASLDGGGGKGVSPSWEGRGITRCETFGRRLRRPRERGWSRSAGQVRCFLPACGTFVLLCPLGRLLAWRWRYARFSIAPPTSLSMARGTASARMDVCLQNRRTGSELDGFTRARVCCAHGGTWEKEANYGQQEEWVREAGSVERSPGEVFPQAGCEVPWLCQEASVCQTREDTVGFPVVAMACLGFALPGGPKRHLRT